MEKPGLSRREEPAANKCLSKDLPVLQETAVAGSEPLDVLRLDAEALGVTLLISLPLPERSRLGELYYADWLDGERRRQPALDTDIYRWVDPISLIYRCLQAVAGSGGDEIVILDQKLAEIARISS